jgi:hypothetical protein
MSNYLFADSVSNVSVINGIVRIELVASILEGQNDIKSSSAGTLALPLSGFINMHAQIDSIIKKMLEDGLLKPNDQLKAPLNTNRVKK